LDSNGINIERHRVAWNLIVWWSFCEHVLFGVRDGHAVTASISVSLGPRDIVRVSKCTIRLRSEEQSAVEFVRFYRVRSVALTGVSDKKQLMLKGRLLQCSSSVLDGHPWL